jgi:hypothetical protein
MEATGFENNGSRGRDPSQLPHAAAARPRDGAEAVGRMEGSRFYRDPVCTHILETPRLRGGRVRAGGSRERLLTPLQPTVIHFVSYQSNTINQAASWDVSGSRLLDNVSEIRRCLHDQLRLRATFKSGSPPGARPPHQVTAIAYVDAHGQRSDYVGQGRKGAKKSHCRKTFQKLNDFSRRCREETEN